MRSTEQAISQMKRERARLDLEIGKNLAEWNCADAQQAAAFWSKWCMRFYDIAKDAVLDESDHG